jgi:D-glycero-D-manno-heptose 1,7-bisphosphate phosphatase
MRPAVFLDRDGTLIEEIGYLTPASNVRVFPWTIDAIRLLKRAGFAVIVVTNQAAIGRGLFTEAFVEQTHRTLAERFAAGGAIVDDWEFCPHHPEAVHEHLRHACACRKPGVGMVLSAARKLGSFDFGRSWVVGDYWRDVELGHAIGARSILVRYGHGPDLPPWWPPAIAPPAAMCDNLMAAVARILVLEGR